MSMIRAACNIGCNEHDVCVLQEQRLQPCFAQPHACLMLNDVCNLANAATHLECNVLTCDEVNGHQVVPTLPGDDDIRVPEASIQLVGEWHIQTQF